jgi:hypothetical protein
MAEFVMKDLVAKAGREAEFYIESAATSTEEIGNAVYPPARRKLAEHGIGCAGKTSVTLPTFSSIAVTPVKSTYAVGDQVECSVTMLTPGDASLKQATYWFYTSWWGSDPDMTADFCQPDTVDGVISFTIHIVSKMPSAPIISGMYLFTFSLGTKFLMINPTQIHIPHTTTFK